MRARLGGTDRPPYTWARAVPGGRAAGCHHAPEAGPGGGGAGRGHAARCSISAGRRARPPACLAPAAAWLRKYTAPTESGAPARLEGWFERARRATRGSPSKRCASSRRHSGEIGALAAADRGALAGGDLPRRFSSQQPAGCGEAPDRHRHRGSGRKLPVYKDMARFLSHMGRRGLAPSGQRGFGVDAGDRDAFAERLRSGPRPSAAVAADHDRDRGAYPGGVRRRCEPRIRRSAAFTRRCARICAAFGPTGP